MKKQIKSKPDGFQIFSLIILGIGIGILGTGLYFDYQTKFNKDFTIQDVCLSCSKVYGNVDYKTLNLTDFLNNVEKNCGSTYFTKGWNSNEYKLFGNKCNPEGYCKTDYISLDCIYRDVFQ